MHTSPPMPLFRSLSAKLMRVVFSIYLLVAVLVTAVHIWVDFSNTRKNVIQNLTVTQKAYDRALARAVWFMDADYLKSELKGILENPNIIGIKVNDDKSNLYAAGEVVQNSNSAPFIHYYNRSWIENHTLKNSTAQLLEHAFPLIHVAEDNEKYEVGTVTIYSSNSVVFNKLKPRVILLIVNSIIKTAALGLIFLLVGRRLLGAPLAGMAHSASKINLDNLEESKMNMALQEHNELKILENAFNTMIENLIAARQRLKDFMQSEKETLEVLVAERTRELVASEASHRRSEAEMHALFTSMTDVIMVLNHEGRYLKIAPTSPRLLYKPSKDLINKKIHDIFPQKEADRFLQVIQESLAKQSTLSFEYDMVINQEQVWFDGRISPISADTVIFVARDITQRRQGEIELEHAKQKAETANRTKSGFLANMSHELRTPLNAILGFSELMLRDPNISRCQRDNLETIGRSGEHLLLLINDVLEFSKIEAGKFTLHPESFDFHRLIISLQELFQLRAFQKGLSLHFPQEADIPKYIRTDQNILRQVLINLLANAIKYTETGEIKLSITPRKTDKQSECEDCFLDFEVVDTGIGIPQQEQEKIFDAFFQIHTRNASQQGTGLGLSISQKFTKLMGGILTVNSTLTQGTSFSFTIPVALADAADSDMETDPSRLRHRVTGIADGQPVFRLLVVEDNDINRRLLVKLLGSVGFTVKEAVNGQEAIEIWEKWQPHLIWMDMRMPVMDGYQVTSHIKNSPEGRDTVIIALTACAFKTDHLKVIEHGGDDFLSKPFREAKIFAMLEKHLGIKFIYNEKEGNRTPQTGQLLSIDDMESLASTLPLEMLVRLAEVTELSDSTMIDQLIDEVRSVNVQLADGLAKLAENFAYDKILNIAWKAKEIIPVSENNSNTANDRSDI